MMPNGIDFVFVCSVFVIHFTGSLSSVSMRTYLLSNRLTNAFAGSEMLSHALAVKEGSWVSMAFLH